MTSNQLVKFEIEQFKKGWGRNLDLTKLTSSNVDACMSHALWDALNQGARRAGVAYKPKLSAITSAFNSDFLDIAKAKTKISNKSDYEKIFKHLKNKFVTVLSSNGLSVLANIGFAQKFINMTFKYLYCFDDCKRTNLQYCHLPLDQYTIDWYKQYGDKTLVEKFKKINFAWANIDEPLYWGIQNDIDSKLDEGIKYPINCVDPKQLVKLPTSKIKVEFIVWTQQQLNVIYNNTLLRVKDYYDRLGIKEI